VAPAASERTGATGKAERSVRAAGSLPRVMRSTARLFLKLGDAPQLLEGASRAYQSVPSRVGQIDRMRHLSAPATSGKSTSSGSGCAGSC
jgi:hypothetical protein